MRRVDLHHRVSHRDDVGDHSLIDVLLGLQEGMQLPLGDISGEMRLVLAARGDDRDLIQDRDARGHELLGAELDPALCGVCDDESFS